MFLSRLETTLFEVKKTEMRDGTISKENPNNAFCIPKLLSNIPKTMGMNTANNPPVPLKTAIAPPMMCALTVGKFIIAVRGYPLSSTCSIIMQK